MFENYSLADLFANVYKKLKINIIALVVLYLLVAVPLAYKTITTVETKTSTSNYSSYIIYKVTSEKKINTTKEVQLTAYSDFYQKIISSNMNGAYLFSETSNEKLEKYALSIGSDITALKTSNKDFWVKKIVVNSLGDDNGVSVEILTPSKELNTLLEEKFDKLVNEYKDIYEGVKVEKLNTVYSGSGEIVKETVTYNKKALLIKLVIVFVGLTIVVIGFNFVLYIFNPTINRAGDYSKYKEVEKVFDIDNKSDFDFVKKYFTEEFTLITTEKSIANKLADVKVIENLADLEKISKVVFVEEYGITRYSKFEKQLQQLNSFDKEILGVISFKL